MICESCEYCHSGIISYLDFNNINTDLGTRIIQCLKQLDMLEIIIMKEVSKVLMEQ